MLFDPQPLSFERDGRDWPNREASAFVETKDFRWHIQRMGKGPKLFMLHGTGASTHSWAGLLPLLAKRFDVLAPDLPGHAFTQAKRSPDLSLRGMTRACAALLGTLDFPPKVVVGHSAGAAILAQMCLTGCIAPDLLVSLNGAFLPFEGPAQVVFPSIAKLLFLNPLVPRAFSWMASENSVANLIAGTGSHIDRRGLDLYARLIGNPAHVAGALGMMANWDLSRMADDLPRLRMRVLFVVGANDKAVPPRNAEMLAASMPNAQVVVIPNAGHLAHEEKPEETAEIIFEEAARLHVISPAKAKRPPRRHAP